MPTHLVMQWFFFKLEMIVSLWGLIIHSRPQNIEFSVLKGVRLTITANNVIFKSDFID